ncbi:hypothetical protein N7492_003099 [Penicillium capsulatum]|uniref:MT-A70 family n=1 Tax=Penicillium capsulatum TaxID=69766 RepID=A0A9W9LWN3_9EURO|nr:hypothetical protein N7492_003099 [Penicillium capsulatum]KAJ6122310.1 hypothetical protein N7512_004775 [Penicillium capsulatum]
MDTNSGIGASSILFQNEAKSLFLIDIPHSIALAQDLPPKPTADQDTSSQQKERFLARRKRLLSKPPLEAPYPSSNEPRKEAARAKVLESIPPGERRFHGDFIRPLVNAALHDLHDNYSTRQCQWCLPRYVIDSGEDVGSGARKRKNESLEENESFERPDSSNTAKKSCDSSYNVPPLILSTTSTNTFSSRSDLRGVVKNPSLDSAVLSIKTSQRGDTSGFSEYLVPPKSCFVHCTLPLASATPIDNPIPGITPSQKFNLIVFDPPWPNRSVRRSGHYKTYNYTEMDILTQRLQDILRVHAHDQSSEPSAQTSRHDPPKESQKTIAAIWITNSRNARQAAYAAMLSTGFRVSEEWIWIKTTVDGQPVSPVDGLWKRPYEILVVGKKTVLSQPPVIHSLLSSPPDLDSMGIDPESIKRRVIAAVPDLHSRKPCLKEIFEKLFYMTAPPEERTRQPYTGLEVFARNLTAGWWACGNEVLKFNDRKYWHED